MNKSSCLRPLELQPPNSTNLSRKATRQALLDPCGREGKLTASPFLVSTSHSTVDALSAGDSYPPATNNHPSCSATTAQSLTRGSCAISQDQDPPWLVNFNVEQGVQLVSNPPTTNHSFSIENKLDRDRGVGRSGKAARALLSAPLAPDQQSRSKSYDVMWGMKTPDPSEPPTRFTWPSLTHMPGQYWTLGPNSLEVIQDAPSTRPMKGSQFAKFT